MHADKEGMVEGRGGGGGGPGIPSPLPLDFKNKSSVINNTITTIMTKKGLFKFLCLSGM